MPRRWRLLYLGSMFIGLGDSDGVNAAAVSWAGVKHNSNGPGTGGGDGTGGSCVEVCRGILKPCVM